MKTLSETVVTSQKTKIKTPSPHNPNYRISEEHFRIDIPWEYSAKLGFTFSVDQAKVWLDSEGNIVLTANYYLKQDLQHVYDVPLYFHKENGNPKSTNVDECYDSQFITLSKNDFTDYNIGDTITINYVDPCPPNATWTQGIDKTTVLEGERHLVIHKGEQHGLEHAHNSTNGEIQKVDREGHQTVQNGSD